MIDSHGSYIFDMNARKERDVSHEEAVKLIYSQTGMDVWGDHAVDRITAKHLKEGRGVLNKTFVCLGLINKEDGEPLPDPVESELGDVAVRCLYNADGRYMLVRVPASDLFTHAREGRRGRLQTWLELRLKAYL